MSERLEHGRACHGRRAWSDAYRTLLAVDHETPLAAEDLDRLATAAYLTGRTGEFQRVIERLHRIHVEAGDCHRAARCAFWLGLSLLLGGEGGQSHAWIARGQRLIDGRDCVERGYLLVPIAEQQLQDGHPEAARATAAEAVAIGERFSDADLTAAARHAQGRALLLQAEIGVGLGLLDETMLAVVAGELSPIMTGLMYCSVIEACREVYAIGRAWEWTLALSEWCARQEDTVFTGACLVHRAEILTFRGAWSDAEAEACRACERSLRAERPPAAEAIYQRAEIHRLRGAFADAEEGYRAASGLGRDPQPGLALLRLAQGQTEAAGAAIRRVVGSTADLPRRARLLPAHVDIMLASGDIEEARRAGAELQAIAERFGADALRAAAAQAQGAIALADGDAAAALPALRCAFELWQRLECAYESARVRALVADACRVLGDDEAAGLEREAARSALEKLGAVSELARLDRPDPAPAPGRRHPLTPRELAVLRLIATGQTNKAIAASLSVSERTIDRHVSNVLGKLDVPSRAAATAYAYAHKLF